jgi:lambda family phage portal protein
MFSNPTVATLIETFATYAVGCGLTLSSRPNADALGISPEAARTLAHQIETGWAAWAGNPVECDATGRFTTNQLATIAFRSYLATGESVFLLDWRKNVGATTRTKINLIDSRQLDLSITRVAIGGPNSGRIMQGVQFSEQGELEGYWIRPFVIGNFSSAPQPIFVRARTSWGRQKAVHLFDPLMPNQIRGISPLAAALTSAQSKRTLQEFGLAAALAQAMFAVTVESDMPRDVAMKGLATDDFIGAANNLDAMSGEQGASRTGGYDAWLQQHSEFYGKMPISLDPAKINHLLRGEKMVMHQSKHPNSTYDAADKSLAREAAKASGGSYEDVSGDYSQTSFSAARLAGELPWRINKRRRAAIVDPFYRAAFMAWMEESCETGRIQLPKGAPEFWQAKDAYTNAVWRGEGKPVADPLKAAQADILEIENGLSTLEAALGVRGYDLEEVIAQRKAERDQLVAAGLPYPVPKNRDDWKPEDDTPSK